MNTTFDRAWSGDQGTLKSVRGKDGVACSSAELLTVKHSSIAFGIKDQNSGGHVYETTQKCLPRCSGACGSRGPNPSTSL